MLDIGEESLIDETDILKILKDIRMIKHSIDCCNYHEDVVNGKKILHLDDSDEKTKTERQLVDEPVSTKRQ